MSRLHSRLGDERGFTLIELLVTIMIGIIVMSAAMGLTEVGARSTARTTDRVETIQRSRTALTQIVQGLRSQVCRDSATPPLVTGDGSSVTYYSDVDNQATFAPQKRQLSLVSTGKPEDPRIEEKVWLPLPVAGPPSGPPWTYDDLNPTRTRTLVSRVSTVGATPFLRYYSFEGTVPLAEPLSTDTTTAPLPTNSIAKVVRIDVSFRTGPSSGNTDAVRQSDLETSIYLRNTDYTDLSPTTYSRTWGPRCD